MKVVVLMIDGLGLRDAARYASLRQAECGQIDMTGFWPPRTHVIWSSFITGLPPEEHGVLPESNARVARIRRGVRTVFDAATSWLALWVPGYNPHPLYWFPKHIELTVKARSAPNLAAHRRRFAEFERELLKLFGEQRRVVLSAVGGGWDLVAAHFNLIDAVSHAARDLSAVTKHVVLVAKLVHDVKERMGGGALLLASDHGMKHAPDAFYSCNVPLGLKSPKVTDFYDVIAGLLRRRS